MFGEETVTVWPPVSGTAGSDVNEYTAVEMISARPHTFPSASVQRPVQREHVNN